MCVSRVYMGGLSAANITADVKALFANSLVNGLANCGFEFHFRARKPEFRLEQLARADNPQPQSFRFLVEDPYTLWS